MSKVFEPMSAEQRAKLQRAYLAHLRRRDGVPDMRTQRFDLRERYFAELDANPTLWTGKPPIDQAVFDRNLARARPERRLDERTLWALATSKTNRAELFGVEYSISHKGHASDAAESPHAYIQIEELYHTRILRDALATLGVKMEVGPPGFSARALIKSMTRLPDGYANVLVLCGELFGVAAFSFLLEKARRLFAEQPLALARLESLFGQILVDEVGHVHYVRSLLSPAQLAWARRLLPMVAWGAMRDLPELVELFGEDALISRASGAHVDEAAKGHPDRFVFAA